jgi:ferredoxin
LEGADDDGLVVPYSCRVAVCITCTAEIVAGPVDLIGFAMISDLKDEGFVLTCSARQRSQSFELVLSNVIEIYDKYVEGGRLIF